MHQLEMAWRGDREQLTVAPGQRLDNPYSLNTVDVCPVGALTSKDFRFTLRAWGALHRPSVCPGCATGCNVELHHGQNEVWRLVPRENPAVNKYWMCDDGRFTYKEIRHRRQSGARIGRAGACRPRWRASTRPPHLPPSALVARCRRAGRSAWCSTRRLTTSRCSVCRRSRLLESLGHGSSLRRRSQEPSRAC